MEKYPLQALLNVRQYREKNAQNAVRQAENAYKECAEQCQKQAEAVQSYHTWRLAEEERKYDEIMGTCLTAEELDNFKQYFSKLKEKELALEEELAKLEKQKQAAKEQIAVKREEFKTAKKNTAKIEAHQKIWKQEEKKEQERKEDLEAEEFKPLSPIGTENSE